MEKINIEVPEGYKAVWSDDGLTVTFEKVEDKVERWKPSYGDWYFFAYEKGFIHKATWSNHVLDNERYAQGNCFKCEKYTDHMSKDQYIRNMIFHACKMVEPDYEFRHGHNNFYPEAGRVNWEVGVTGDYQHRSPAFVSSSKNARKVMALLESWGVL